MEKKTQLCGCANYFLLSVLNARKNRAIPSSTRSDVRLKMYLPFMTYDVCENQVINHQHTFGLTPYIDIHLYTHIRIYTFDLFMLRFAWRANSLSDMPTHSMMAYVAFIFKFYLGSPIRAFWFVFTRPPGATSNCQQGQVEDLF